MVMDIFTTQLRRVVPVRIKPEKLKVKALAKDDRVGKIDEEQDHSLKDEVDVYIHNQQDEHSSDSEMHHASDISQEDADKSTSKDNEKSKGNRLDIFV